MIFTRDMNWPHISGKKAKCIKLVHPDIPSFDAHKENIISTWPHIYGNKTGVELEKIYSKYVVYLKNFNGCCALNDVVDIVPLDEKNVIILSKQWRGYLRDDADLELWLRISTIIPWIKRGNYSAEIYSFGTATIYPGDRETLSGAKTGSQRVSHKIGIYKIIFNDIETPKSFSLKLMKGVGTKFATFEILDHYNITTPQKE